MMYEKIGERFRHSKIVWQKHALQRMMERGITRGEVKEALLNGEIIENYPDDSPFPSMLIAWVDNKPLHVVVAFDRQCEEIYVITVYRPDLRYFETDMKTRRKR